MKNSKGNGVKNWMIENLVFLITLIFGVVALYTTFQNLVYRMDQVEARVTKFEGMVVPRVEFNTLIDQVNRIEGKIDSLLLE